MKVRHLTGLGAIMLWAALAGPAVWAQAPAQAGAPPSPDGSSPAQKAARRWPQPVRVGDLRDRLVIEPSNHQTVLGRVDGVVRSQDGSLSMVVRYGGLLGVGARPIAVPVDAIALLGQYVEVVDLDRTQLSALPRYQSGPDISLPPDDVIRIGVTRN